MQGRAAVVPIAFAIALGLLSPSLAQNEAYPNRQIRLLVSSAPGGNPDILGRLLAERMIMREDGTANYIEFRKQDAERYANIVRRLNLHVN